MQHYMIRKIRLYPLASVGIALLISAIITFESGVLFPENITDNNVVHSESIATRINTQITGDESSQIVDQNNNADTDVVSGMSSARDTELAILEENTRIEAKLELETHQSIKGIDPVLANLLAAEKFNELREELLKLASIAVLEKDKKRLGYILNLLGQVSIQEQDVYSAEVYLLEALDIFQNMNDEIGVAQINLQLGRTHLKSRQIARVAGTAYDELQVGRWYLAHKMPSVAEQYIRKSIDRNMSINRFGSAASAYESLVKLFLGENNFDAATIAALESARMFASSGKIDRANGVLELIPANVNNAWQLAQLRTELDQNHQQYKKGILQIERARDYRRLYYFYRNQGDQERAWKFRLLASNSLGEVSKRTLFHRQQGVLAILFNSNESIDQAESYFVKARNTFDNNGMTELSNETSALNNQVY
jgi:tetratricopeptide (TPR) repeat protein